MCKSKGGNNFSKFVKLGNAFSKERRDKCELRVFPENSCLSSPYTLQLRLVDLLLLVDKLCFDLFVIVYISLEEVELNLAGLSKVK